MARTTVRLIEDFSQSGVYQILNILNGKRYVGSASKSFSSRWNGHRRELRLGSHRNGLLQRAWNKYGEESFEFLICEVVRPEHCVCVEQVMIDFYKSADRRYGYNLSPTAGSPRGVKHSDNARAANAERARQRMKDPDARKRLSDINTGKKQTPEAIAKTRAANTGRKRSPEQRERMSIAATGRKMSPESVAKQAAAIRGRKHSEEHKAKNSAANMGKKMSPEAIEKCAASKRGKPRSADTRAKISAALVGRKLTLEQCQKIGNAHSGKKKSKEAIAKRTATRAANMAIRALLHDQQARQD